MSDVITIGIAGGTGSGKTTITRRILYDWNCGRDRFRKIYLYKPAKGSFRR